MKASPKKYHIFIQPCKCMIQKDSKITVEGSAAKMSMEKLANADFSSGQCIYCFLNTDVIDVNSKLIDKLKQTLDSGLQNMVKNTEFTE
jgi:hypothetical protein